MAKRKGHIPWSREELRRPGPVRTYRGRELDMVAFPLGGIGTGCLSLGGWGQLRDWEVFGKPGKGNENDMAFFSLLARPRGADPVLKVLQGPTGGPRMGPPSPKHYAGGGSGAWGRSHGAGMPHFASCEFTAHYPFAVVRLSDATMKLRATLTAWNPLIPLNDRDSSIPCAVFLWKITNPTKATFDAVLYANLTNTIGFPDTGRGVNAFRDTGRIRGIEYTTGKHEPSSPRYGTLSLATPHRRVTYLQHWRRGSWFDALTDFWSQAKTGKLDESVPAEVSGDAAGETATLGLRFTLAPGQSKELPVVIAWHFPLQEKCWGKPTEGRNWTKYYATQWKDAWETSEYVLSNLPRLQAETRLYDETLRSSTLPGCVVEAVASTSSILKSPTCLRLTNGEFWGWEGCNDSDGCCQGTTTHVWNYQQTLAYLFPRLERGIRETDYANNLHPQGNMSFRMPLPLGERGDAATEGAADGQLGGILKVYREWKMSGDDGWLARVWPLAKRSLEYAWVHWDADKDGVLEGVQHNTYDIQFWGPNTMCSSFYLAALRAGEEISRRLGDHESAARYSSMFVRGREWIDGNLWNGEYYEQRVDPDAGKAIQPLGDKGTEETPDGMPKYQYGSGCLSDQLLGQLFAEMLELGDLFDRDHIDRAAESIFRNNWRDGFFDHENPQRIYAQDEERGLLLCTWPRGGKPPFPFPYSDEVWTGIEYAAAALLVYRGLIDEALAVVTAVRERYDGTRRNPFDEFECGHHYARALASYAVLLALSGFAADLPNRRLAFHPRINEERFRCFFAVDSGWGLYRQDVTGAHKARYSVDVKRGKVTLQTLSVPWMGTTEALSALRARATLGGATIVPQIRRTGKGVDFVFPRALLVKEGRTIEIVVSKGVGAG